MDLWHCQKSGGARTIGLKDNVILLDVGLLLPCGMAVLLEVIVVGKLDGSYDTASEGF
jgi:hypothetical protein